MAKLPGTAADFRLYPSGGSSCSITLMSEPEVLDLQAAETAYRRAWWSLALYPITFVAAFVVGEGLYSWLDDGGDNPFWVPLVSATPALMIFLVPGVLSVRQGRKAMRLGRGDGRTPAIVGAAVGAGFVLLNLISALQ